ncbi:ABC transporter ATP-binding protein [Roseateles terrae]|uniref:Multiple sugar transport system ATP-binding protein n=1 Tax=Roseateles terrae TaxID=431060 RepID=A0ABR6GPX5_9BURK|nr:ATP-binding cassette domain-containing protein [Roseateles terrae]MBB3193289.1 multiple sugar transport system ATP-binding protein [Roseateles terrae]OWQ89504.1 ABC transporter [Roseateles terrae]
MASVQLDRIGKTYVEGGVPTVHEVSLDIAEGEFCVFVGPSGCGKSTLLRMIAGLDTITSGELRIGGRRVNELAPGERDVAMVFQSYALYPHLDVADNLGFGLRLARVPKLEARKRIEEVARLLQIDHLLQRKPRELSGGQRQRVAIGRALVRQPGVFLFDEPLSNLDAALRQQTRLEIARLHRSQGRACSIYVTHDQVEAMTLADRMVLLQPPPPGATEPQASVAQCGAPLALYHRPRNLFVAGFLGSPRMNFLPATVRARGGDGVHVALQDGAVLSLPMRPDAVSVGDAVTLGVRAEHLRPATGSDPRLTETLSSQVQWMEHLGDQSLAYLTGPGGSLVLRLPEGAATPQVGDALPVAALRDEVHLFDTRGDAVPRLQDEVAPCA